MQLGSYGKLAAELGTTAARARSWARRGPPVSWSETELLELMSRLYRRWRAEDDAIELPDRKRVWNERRRRQEKARAERERPKYAEVTRRKAAEALVRELDELERRRPCEGGRWSPRAHLGRELGVRSSRIARWVAAGSVPEAFMPEFDAWAQARAEEKMRSDRERAQVEDLLAQAQGPGKAHVLTGSRGPRRARRAPVVPNNEGRTESEKTSGYSWRKSVEGWLTFSLIDQLAAWALARKRPPGALAKPARLWIVTALTSVLTAPGQRGPRSPGGVRQFGAPKSAARAVGVRLYIGTPISSRTVKRGGLARAVHLFRLDAIEHLCEFDSVWVHGLVVRNWRDRTPLEQANYRSREEARWEAQNRASRLKADRRRKKARALARKKARARIGKR